MRRTFAVLAAVVLCLSLSAGVAVAAHEEPDRTALGFELGPQGEATVTWVDSYDLSNESQRATYESYAENETRQAEFREAAVADLESGAETGSEATGWDMAIQNATVRTYEADGYGRVEVRADWEAFAYYDERTVIVAQPFRNGYHPDRDLAFHGPQDYRRNRTAPQPIRARSNSVLIERRSDYSGFFVEFVDPDAPTESPTPTATASATGPPADDGGGLGLVARALLLALIPAALLVLALRRS